MEEEVRPEKPPLEEGGPPTSIAKWEAGWRALRDEAEQLERESWEEIAQQRSLNCTQLSELLAEHEEVERSTSEWRSELWSSLGLLRKQAAVVAEKVRQGFPQEQLQAATVGVEEEIAGFRQRQRAEFEGLAEEEFQGGRDVEEALQRLGGRFAAWAAEPSALEPRPLQQRGRAASAGAVSGGGAQPRQPSAGSRAGRAPAAAPVAAPAEDDAELREIRDSLKELEAAVEQAGGATGGWSMLHHSIFQRIFAMFKMQASEAFYARLAERLTDVPQERLAEHVRWWGEDQSRQVAKRQLLARWRQRRADLDRQAAEAEEGKRAQSLAQRRRAEERRQSQRAEEKKRVADWRRQRNEEEERGLAAQRSALQERARQEREQLKIKQEQSREALEAYRSRGEPEAVVPRERSMERSGDAGRRQLSQEDRQRIAQRNVELLQRRLQAQPQAPPSGWLPPPPAKSKEWADVESRLHCGTLCSMMKTTSKSSEASQSLAGPGGGPSRSRELPPRW